MKITAKFDSCVSPEFNWGGIAECADGLVGERKIGF